MNGEIIAGVFREESTMPQDEFWVTFIAALVASAAIVGAAILILRGRGVGTPTGAMGSRLSAPHSCVVCCVAWTAYFLPDTVQHAFPLNVLIPGVLVTVSLALVANACFALSYSFRQEWHWRTALWQSSWVIFAGTMAVPVYDAVQTYHATWWVWIFAGIQAVYLTPFLVRFVHLDIRTQETQR